VGDQLLEEQFPPSDVEHPQAGLRRGTRVVDHRESVDRLAVLCLRTLRRVDGHADDFRVGGRRKPGEGFAESVSGADRRRKKDQGAEERGRGDGRTRGKNHRTAGESCPPMLTRWSFFNHNLVTFPPFIYVKRPGKIEAKAQDLIGSGYG
jgi:hypothetical protein